MAMLKQRLFFALWPGEPVRKALAEAAASLKPKLAARWVRPDNLHITLAFLGDVEAERVGAACEAADAVAAPGFVLRLDILEHWRRPQVLCLTPSATPPTLAQLAADLAGQLQAAGFALDQRPYRAHLTLARKAPPPPPGACLATPVLWQAGEFVLVESRRDGQGSAYGILKAWPLADVGQP